MRVDPHYRALVSVLRPTTCRVGSPWWSCSQRARVNAAKAAESQFESSAKVMRMLGPSYWRTYQRHCGMLRSEILVFVPAALCERWAQGFDVRVGTCAGQPTRELVGRVTVVVSGNPWYFLTRPVPPSRSQRSSTWCRRVWFYFWRCLTSTAGCPRSLLLSPYPYFSASPFPLSSLVSSDLPGSQAAKSILQGAGLTSTGALRLPRSSFLCSLFPPSRSQAAHRFQHIYHFGIFGPIIRGRRDGPGPPSPLRLRLPGPWPAARTHGGVELNCELNVSHGFSFVEACYILHDGPSYPRVKGMCNTVDGSGLSAKS